MAYPWIFQLDNHQGYAIHKQHHIRATFDLVLHDRELVDRYPVSLPRAVEIDRPNLRSRDGPVGPGILDGNSIDHHAVRCMIAFDKRSSIDATELVVGLLQRFMGQCWI